MNKSDAVDLQNAAYELYTLLDQLGSWEEMVSQRDAIRTLVHTISAAYLNWAIGVDNAKLEVIE